VSVFVLFSCALSISPPPPPLFATRSFRRSRCSGLLSAEMAEETPVETPAAPVLGEPMDLMTALQLVMKKSSAHDGLVKGLREAAKAIEKHAAQLCVLAEDCDQPDYVKLVKALCAEHNVHLVTVPSAKTLGEWAGVSYRILLSTLSIVFLDMC
jgi:small subunit ribosomal protein S12e